MSKKTEERVAKSVPFALFEYVDVLFPDADEDVFIEHSLKTDRPNDIRYEVVSRNTAGMVYHDGSAGRRAWQSGYLLLRCSVANTTVRLRLFIEP